MDIDIGTLIYIIITIIVVIVGAMGKKKRLAGGLTGTDDGEQGSRGFFESLEDRLEGFIDESNGGEEQESYETSVAEPPVQTIHQEDAAGYQRFGDKYEETPAQPADHYSHYAGILDPEKQENLDQIREDAANQDQGILDVIDIDDMVYPDYYDIVRDFDLGTAVIYSSIINRKEY